MTYFLRLLAAAFLCLLGIDSSLADLEFQFSSSSSSSSGSQSLRRRATPAAEYEPEDYENEIVAAVAAAKSSYEQLAKDYREEGCETSWGKLPTAKNPNPPIKGGGNLCKCGMLHDLAAAHIATPQDESYARAVAAHGGAKASLSLTSGETETSLATVRANLDLDMSNKQLSESAQKVNSWLLARTANGPTACSKTGYADGYPCRNVDLVAHMPLSDFRVTVGGFVRGPPSGGNDVWGWTHSHSGREFVIWGVQEGHYFVEVTPDDNPIVLGFLPSTRYGTSKWHDVKVIGNYAYMGSEIERHGMQVFDLRQLVQFNPSNCVDSRYCRQLSPDTTYFGPSSHQVSRSHNIVVNEDSNYVYIVGGGNGCGGGLHVVDVRNPGSPTFKGCFDSEGYVHDAQCVNYKGPDKKFQDSEICFCYNAHKVVIVDVTNKNNMQRLSTMTYAKKGYTHQGWLSSDQTHIIFGDEKDELVGDVSKTRSIIINVEDLRNPGSAKTFLGRTNAIDHNQYIVDYPSQTKGSVDLVFQSNYQAGLQILQAVDYNTANFKEVGYFDTYPTGTTNAFSGAWSVYPYFPSGLVAISGIGEGLFLVQPNIPDSALVGDSCINDENFIFRGDPKKTCEWIASNPNRVRKFCPRKNNNGVPVSASCPETCDSRGASCPACDDNQNFKFRDDKKKTCGWIASNSKRVQKYCPRKNNDGVRVSKSCPETCNSRDASCPAVELPCQDDETFQFRDDPTKSCGWIGSYQDRVQNYCPRKNNDGVLVSISCPETCDTIPVQCGS